jgi:predicted XRE-type DNA-binding protein
MKNDDTELVHGSGNVFRDLGHTNPEAEQLKAILAAKIIGALDDEAISVRRAHELTGFAAADFSRVRQAKLSRFTIDRLMSMLARLDQDVEITVTVQPRRAAPAKSAKRVKRGAFSKVSP